MLVPGKREGLRQFLLPRFRNELALRTPDVLAACIEFRTARQQWTRMTRRKSPTDS